MEFLCLDFVNSTWYITNKLFADPLRDNKWLLNLAGNWNIKGLSAPTEAELVCLSDMRSRFAVLLLNICNGTGLSSTDMEPVNHYMDEVKFYRQFLTENSFYKLELIPEYRNWKWFMAEVAASFSSLCSSDALNRLKACQNPDCGWFFIDDSKSGNRKWCDDSCSSLMKVRRFRERKKLK